MSRFFRSGSQPPADRAEPRLEMPQRKRAAPRRRPRAEPPDGYDYAADAFPDPDPAGSDPESWGDARYAGEQAPRIRDIRQAGVASAHKRSGAGRIALYGLLGVLALVVLGVSTFVLFAAPGRLIEERVIAEVEARTGRRLTLTAPTSFSFFPSAGVTLRGVTLSGPPAMPSPPLLSAEQVEISVRLMPLLAREVAIEQLVLQKPVISLTVDAAGRRNWDFAALAPRGGRIRLAQATTAPDLRGTRTDLPPVLQEFLRNATDPKAAGEVTAPHKPGAAVQPMRLGHLEDIMLGDVRIVGGTVRYADLRSGLQQEATAIDARLGMRSLSGPLDVSGTLTWRGEPLSIEARADAPRALIEGRPSRLMLIVNGAPAGIGYEGSITKGDTLSTEGTLRLETPSARRLAQWLGTELAAAPAFGAGSVAGRVSVRDARVSLDASAFRLGSLDGRGTISADLSRPRPFVEARLQVAALDLSTFRASGAPEGGRVGSFTPAARGGDSASEGRAAPSAMTIEDLLKRDGGDIVAPAGPRVRGFTQRDGWSNEPLDVTPLGLVDADARLEIARLAMGDLRAGRTDLRVSLKDGGLRLDIEDLQLYRGRATGFITVTSGAVPQFGGNLQMRDVEALPLLKAASGFDWLSGMGNVTLAMAGAGRSEREIIESLKGRTTVRLNNGALIGYDLKARLGDLARGRLSGLERVASEQTRFSAFSATFDTVQGQATTKNLTMTSDIVHMTGDGTIGLPQRAVDLTMRPKLLASAGAGAASGGLEIPVRVHGPWAKPAVTPNLDAALKDPNQVVETIKQIGKKIDKKSFGDKLKKLLDGGTEGTNDQRPAQKPSELLRQLFKN